MSRRQVLKAAVTAAGTVQSGRYVTVAVYALVVYEWMITFDDELRLIHRARWSSVKFAFLCCRYYPIICWVVYLWAFIQNHELELCRHVVKPLFLFMIPFQLSAQAVMIMRAWAFVGRTRTVQCILLAAYAILVALDIWAFAIDVDIVEPSPIADILGKTGCFRGHGRGRMKTPGKMALILVSACFVDFLCSLIIAFHCLRLRSLQGPLGRTFVVQGIGAFVIMTAVHITSATISFRNTTAFAGGIIVPIPLILSNIVACRLILALRRRTSPTETEENQELSRLVRNALGHSPATSSKSDQWAS